MPVHGGPDGGPPLRHDFSTNASPLPAPAPVRRALRDAVRTRYPDPAYADLRARLAGWLAVAPSRVLPTAGTAEAIRRLTLALAAMGSRDVWVPSPGYADYAAAAAALGLNVRPYHDAAALLDALAQAPRPVLLWLCEPCNPTGATLQRDFWKALIPLLHGQRHQVVIDRAYEPLRLQGKDPVPAAVARRAWTCGSPNKALGLPGVRAGWLVAPVGARDDMRRVETLAPSWVLSAEGVALLGAWCRPDTQAALARQRDLLRTWAAQQRARLSALGWQQGPTVANFWLARPPEPVAEVRRRLVRLRRQGIKLRDAASLGATGWLRLSAQPPAAQRALAAAWSGSA
jgi:histidinol-phosphate aminotransferase